MQNLVLGLGAAVMAIAVALTPFIYTSLAGELRALILAVLTVVALLLPIAFARRGLITTAEWVAPLGMLLILLDAQEAWVGGLHRFGLRATVYAGVVALIAAGFAFGSHELSKLAMLRFTSIVLVQPVLPLLLYPWLRDTASWASVLAAVAAIDLVIAMRTHRRYPHGPYLRTAVRSLAGGGGRRRRRGRGDRAGPRDQRGRFRPGRRGVDNRRGRRPRGRLAVPALADVRDLGRCRDRGRRRRFRPDRRDDAARLGV